jgi:hypothetical protein
VTRTLIGFKLPAELLGGDLSMFHPLFGRDQRETYLATRKRPERRALAEVREILSGI